MNSPTATSPSGTSPIRTAARGDRRTVDRGRRPHPPASQEMRDIAARPGIALTARLEARGHAALETRAESAYEEFVAAGRFNFRRRDDAERLADVVEVPVGDGLPRRRGRRRGARVPRARARREDPVRLPVHRELVDNRRSILSRARARCTHGGGRAWARRRLRPRSETRFRPGADDGETDQRQGEAMSAPRNLLSIGLVLAAWLALPGTATATRSDHRVEAALDGVVAAGAPAPRPSSMPARASPASPTSRPGARSGRVTASASAASRSPSPPWSPCSSSARAGCG